MTVRIAEQCYWMFRYLERSESLARMLTATYLFGMEDRKVLQNGKHPLLYILNEETQFSEKYPENLSNKEFIEQYLVWQPENPSSLLYSIKSFRENARQIREILHPSIWQTINDLYLWIGNEESVKPFYMSKRYDFYKQILDYCELIKGCFYDFTFRDEYYHLMELGLFVERANQTVRILDELVAPWIKNQSQDWENKEKIEYFSFLLNCCASTDTYLKRSSNFEIGSIIHFFVKESYSPFSIQYCLEQSSSNIQWIISKGSHAQTTSLLTEIEDFIKSNREQEFNKILETGFTREKESILKHLERINDLVVEEFFHLNYLVKG